MPMSTTVSPLMGSKTLSPSSSVHSKLLVVLRDTSITTSAVSLPVTVSGTGSHP